MARRRLLVIDDNELNVELMSFLLEAEGFDIQSAADAEAALKMIAAEQYDALIVDVQLPGMSGLDLLRHLRARPETAKVCAVVVTSYAMDADREQAFEAGCNGYLTKPIDTRTFGPSVRAFLEQMECAGRASAKQV